MVQIIEIKAKTIFNNKSVLKNDIIILVFSFDLANSSDQTCAAYDNLEK